MEDREKLKEHVQRAANIIELVDVIVTNDLVKCDHASEEFKENQRISNAVLNVIRAIETLKYEL